MRIADKVVSSLVQHKAQPKVSAKKEDADGASKSSKSNKGKATLNAEDKVSDSVGFVAALQTAVNNAVSQAAHGSSGSGGDQAQVEAVNRRADRVDPRVLEATIDEMKGKQDELRKAYEANADLLSKAFLDFIA